MKKRCYNIPVACLIVTAAVFLAGKAGLPYFQENWPTYMGNQYLTGNNDGIIPEGGDILWKFRPQGRVYNPVGINDRVYVVSTDNYLYCLDMRDGSVIWKFKSEGALTRMVVVHEGRVYLPAMRFLYCLDAKTGEVLWARRDPSIGFYGTPTVAQGKIFYGNRKGFYARELKNGHLIWENRNIYTYHGFPSYWNGMVYTVSKEFQQESARLIALGEENGSIRWQVELENVSNIYSPVVYRERIFLAFGNRIAVYDATSGEKLLETVFLSPVASNPVFSQGSIFLSLAEGTIIKIDPETGNWEPLYRVPYATQFAVVGSYLFIPVKDSAGGFAVVDAASGKEERRVQLGEGEPTSITVSKGIAFVPSLSTLVAVGKGKFIGLVSVKPEEEAEGEGEEQAEPAPGSEMALPVEIPPSAGTAAEAFPGTETLDTGEVEAPAASGPAQEASTGVIESLPAQEAGAGVVEAVAAPPQGPRGFEEPLAPATPGEAEKGVIRGTVREQQSGRPLSGRVEATTRLADGALQRTTREFKGGLFEIEVPRKGETDLIISAKGYTFETIALPNEKAIDDLSLQPLELELSRAAKGGQFSVESLHFRVESANLEPNSIPTLQNLYQMMMENPAIRIEIAGHTDSTGPADFNMRLSEQRAAAVADWLIKNGISSTRITARGYGGTRPIADNSTEEGRRKNRRTEVVIIGMEKDL